MASVTDWSDRQATALGALWPWVDEAIVGVPTCGQCEARHAKAARKFTV